MARSRRPRNPSRPDPPPAPAAQPAVLDVRRRHPRWGDPLIRALLARVDPAELRQRRAEVIATLQRAVRDADPTVRTRAAELLVGLTRGQ